MYRIEDHASSDFLDSSSVPMQQCNRLSRDSLFYTVARILQRMGGDVRLNNAGENLVRRKGPSEFGSYNFVVEVQGWPNLMHEFVHILALGYLEEDSGFNYGWIPLDLTIRLRRKCLWEELSCCVISCSYFELYPEAGDRSRANQPEVHAFTNTISPVVHRWFAEQLDILPIFYGLEGKPHCMANLIEQTINDHRDEFDDTLAMAFRQVYDSLTTSGLSSYLLSVVTSSHKRFSFADLWAHYRTGVTP